MNPPLLMTDAHTGFAPAGLTDNWIRWAAARSAAAMSLVTFTHVLLTPRSSRQMPVPGMAAKNWLGLAGFWTRSVTPAPGRLLVPDRRAQLPPPSSDR